MRNGINAYNQARLGAYAPAQQTTAPRPAAAPATVRPAERTAAAQAAAPARTGELSSAESSMIDRYFPASESMTMRLYGPGRGVHTVNPGALGRRLDLRG